MNQNEFERIMEAPKEFVGSYKCIVLPMNGRKEKLKAIFKDTDEYINIYLLSSGRNAGKTSNTATYQNNTVLIRIDLAPTPPHQNPDGEIIKESHVHVFKEGFDDKWATPLKDYCDNVNLKEEDLNDRHKIFEFFCYKLTIDKNWVAQLGF